MVRTQYVQSSRVKKTGRLALQGIPNGFQADGITPWSRRDATDRYRSPAVVLGLLLGATAMQVTVELMDNSVHERFTYRRLTKVKEALRASGAIEDLLPQQELRRKPFVGRILNQWAYRVFIRVVLILKPNTSREGMRILLSDNFGVSVPAALDWHTGGGSLKGRPMNNELENC
jgi:hypothetical protein